MPIDSNESKLLDDKAEILVNPVGKLSIIQSIVERSEQQNKERPAKKIKVKSPFAGNVKRKHKTNDTPAQKINEDGFGQYLRLNIRL